MSDTPATVAAQPLKNPKHEAVLQAWIADGERVWWKAWKSVYPKSSQHAAETSCSRLLKGAEFCARRDQLLKAISDQVVNDRVMTEIEVLEELSKLGRSSIKRAILQGDDTAGVVMSLRDMPDDVAATIKTLTIETVVEGNGELSRDVQKIRIELHDKRGPLRDLAQHYGLLTEKHEHTGKDGGPIELEDKTELSPLDVARRIAFALERGKRELGKQKTAPAPAAAKRKAKKPANEAKPAAAVPGATPEPKKD